MENFKGKEVAEQAYKGDNGNSFGRNKELHQMNQEIMLKRLANYKSENTIAQKLNKFFSIFF